MYKEPLDVQPEDYDLFMEANLAVEEIGIMFDDNEFDPTLFEDDVTDEYVSEEELEQEEDVPDGAGSDEGFSNEDSSDDEEDISVELSTGYIDPVEAQSNLPAPVGCGSEKCLVCSRQ